MKQIDWVFDVESWYRRFLYSDFCAYNNRCKNCSIEEKYLTLHVELHTLCFECSAGDSVALRWRRKTEKSKHACLSAGWVRRRWFILFCTMLHRAFNSFFSSVYLFIHVYRELRMNSCGRSCVSCAKSIIHPITFIPSFY